ncbi:hypothetical protein A3D09_01410 [Candidatus Collierbacteria bacterium RIFCSPHIGHO2_02_FULL_49_10]|uniref:Uncharacterized protein n=2 Tax=Candidatus Collieribacteriota TaxID=1752725 RepID=A0A1F5EUW7_9BACT|nr:MAG: hypothetical protein A3D09_01410 [Candidatus Collierbacteria bacterium RIFCSPHIGHO2_02_FULL_49_10]OGD71489.1 MAG: hypothetical protein A2703_03110 [Candidatus Collierbacteria bacterium RIFCSPHIGHO2_01_FULL_50_25]
MANIANDKLAIPLDLEATSTYSLAPCAKPVFRNPKLFGIGGRLVQVRMDLVERDRKEIHGVAIQEKTKK